MSVHHKIQQGKHFRSHLFLRVASFFVLTRNGWRFFVTGPWIHSINLQNHGKVRTKVAFATLSSYCTRADGGVALTTSGLLPTQCFKFLVLEMPAIILATQELFPSCSRAPHLHEQSLEKLGGGEALPPRARRGADRGGDTAGYLDGKAAGMRALLQAADERNSPPLLLDRPSRHRRRRT